MWVRLLRTGFRRFADVNARVCLRGLCLASTLLLTITGAASDLADPFGQRGRELTFYYSVNGYERDAWFGEPAALALDERSNLLYVADRKDGTIDAFSIQGIAKFRYGAKEKLGPPLAVAVDKKGNIYVAENIGGPIKIIDSKRQITTLQLEAAEGDDTPKPGRMTFDRDGNLYVVDQANCRLYVFDKERKLKIKLGGRGEKRGEFKMLQDVAVDRQGRIYALDAMGIPVQVFDRKGKYIYRFGFHGEGDRDLGFPTAIAIDRNDQLWIVDKGQHALKVFDRVGTFLRRFGSYGLGEGTLFHPVDLEIDSFGRVFVAEAGARRLQVFTLSRPYEPFTPAEF